MYLALDGPSAQLTVSVGTVTPVLVKGGAAVLSERKVITLQSRDPSGGNFYVYFAGDAGAPSAATIVSDGMLQYKTAMKSFEASDSQAVYLLSVAGTINVTVTERA